MLDPTGKYTFIGEQPFEVTDWDPAETQQVLTAAIAKNPEIDVIVSDFGPSLVGALPEFEKSGRSIPAIATSDGNVLACFWEDNKAANPDFKLFTISTQTTTPGWRSSGPWRWRPAARCPPTTSFPTHGRSRTRSARQPNPVHVRARPAGRRLPLRARCPARTRRAAEVS